MSSQSMADLALLWPSPLYFFLGGLEAYLDVFPSVEGGLVTCLAMFSFAWADFVNVVPNLRADFTLNLQFTPWADFTYPLPSISYARADLVNYLQLNLGRLHSPWANFEPNLPCYFFALAAFDLHVPCYSLGGLCHCQAILEGGL